MHYLKLTGTLAQLDNLHTIPGLIVQGKSAREIQPGEWQVNGYASEGAINPLTALGLN